MIQETRTEAAAKQPPDRPRSARKPDRPRSLSELDKRTVDLDRRRLEFRRYEAIRSAVIADLGQDAVSTAEAQIADKAAFLAMTLEGMQIASLSGQQIDLQRYGELADRLRRLLEAVGLGRRAKDITLLTQNADARQTLAEMLTQIAARIELRG